MWRSYQYCLSAETYEVTSSIKKNIHYVHSTNLLLRCVLLFKRLGCYLLTEDQPKVSAFVLL